MIGLLKIFFFLPFLLYSCYSDLKTRRVPNKLWSFMLVPGMIFVIYDLINYGFAHLVHLLISFVFIFGFVYVLFSFNAFGGADAKLMIIISIIIPAFPEIDMFGYTLPLNPVPPINLFAFSVFANAVILTIIVPVGLFIYNLIKEPLSEVFNKPWYMFLGYKTSVYESIPDHIRLLEEYEETNEGIRAGFSRSGKKIDSETIEELRNYADKNLISKRIWVTPGLPFMIPITVGFLTTVVYGDLIFYLTSNYIVPFI
ncbi:Peptidase A24B, FlaK domain protein [Methanohalobium evestigatum Z-7303]|uniref:Peptidase A24B, FlaK domain protein n=1 Tax=Methanohalobium evestigatum (strain ATCC BAA-1072 / DSM 3721 / NBRC 107634 / OCM 161 / Z-7303) TaxID=644295 RepID=D7E6X4_METEZ|nr:A24 family peptidase C-terminal domain-containing protein [Methanohalobium evestigatum]ADI73598.1 Peptidase A24B, FlaK domain protein [Methanohalobium evestigatum Z-7303]